MSGDLFLFQQPCSPPGDVPDADLAYHRTFLAPADADTLLEALLALPDWRRERLHLFGRDLDAPRLTAWFGDPGVSYAYSGITHVAAGWPAPIAALRDRLAAALGVRFNAVLANRYRDGRDSMGWHSDDERELGRRPVIASLSLGAQRRFLLRHRSRKDLETLDLPLEHGSLLVMQGDTQRHWRHSLPKTTRCHAERVNLTFRKVRACSPSPSPS